MKWEGCTGAGGAREILGKEKEGLYGLDPPLEWGGRRGRLFITEIASHFYGRWGGSMSQITSLVPDQKVPYCLIKVVFLGGVEIAIR